MITTSTDIRLAVRTQLLNQPNRKILRVVEISNIDLAALSLLCDRSSLKTFSQLSDNREDALNMRDAVYNIWDALK